MQESKKKILAVDDDEMHLYTVKQLLDSENIEVITHKSWLGVTNVLKSLQPDLLLLDINMPALSGDRLSELIRPYCEASSIPIIFYSSNDEESLKKSVKKCNVAGYICKGDIKDLKAKVHHYLLSSWKTNSKISTMT